MILAALLIALLPSTQQIDIPLADAQNDLWTPVAIEGAGFLPSKLTITGHVDSIWQLVVENTSPNAVSAWFGNSPLYSNDGECFSGVSLRGWSGEFLSEAAYLPTVTFRLTPFDGTIDFAGTSGKTSAWMRTRTTFAAVVTDPAVLVLFSSQGPVPLEFERFAHVDFAISNAGNFYQGGMNQTAASLTFAFDP